MLYVIPTPIGNKEDITLRALSLFRSLDTFLSEDTRTTRKLFGMYEIPYTEKTFHSITSYTNPGQVSFFIRILQEKDVGLVSEAGTPGLSDPGKTLLLLCAEKGIPYTILPGANALIPAVVGAGFPTQHFTFLGFFPTKKGRQTTCKTIIASPIPVFFYESVHRIQKTLLQLKEQGFSGRISIAREVSKMFEQMVTAPIDTVLQQFQDKTIQEKGEFVIGCYTGRDEGKGKRDEENDGYEVF